MQQPYDASNGVGAGAATGTEPAAGPAAEPAAEFAAEPAAGTEPAAEPAAEFAAGTEPAADRALATPPAFALNLCDVASARAFAVDQLADLCDRAMADSGAPTIARMYVGSYFCDRFFLTQVEAQAKVAVDFGRAYNTKTTLVLPICSQALLEPVKQLAARLIATLPIDELVVNDLGMLCFAAELQASAPHLSVGLGRLMARSQRDPRYQEMDAAPQPFALDQEAVESLSYLLQSPIQLVEADPFTPLVDASSLGLTPLALHLPRSVMTTGHICPAASQGLPLEQKFRPDAPCTLQCLQNITVHQAVDDRGNPTYLTRQGRTVYFENPACRVLGTEPARIIWTPADFLCSQPEPMQTPEGGLEWDAY